LSETQLRTLQLERLNSTLDWARQHCPYYAERLPKGRLASLDALERLPLMGEKELSQGLTAFLGVAQSELSRIVTLPTSGTTGEPKRIAFTAAEQRDIIDFLASGMRMLAKPGECVAVLYPCERSGSLGELICESIELAGMRALPYGLPSRERGFAHLAQSLLAAEVRGLVGFPQQVFALARWSKHHALSLPVRGVLLSADNVAPALKREIQRIWGAQVYAHYGSTEMGFGGAVECSLGCGQHIRESDLYFEIIDPLSGEALPEGEWGELVFTTLNRKAMPMIRYRSGDISRIIPGSCGCGSILRRLDVVKARATSGTVAGGTEPSDGVLESHAITPKAASLSSRGACPHEMSMYDLEELIFALPGVLDFAAQYDGAADCLRLHVQLLPGSALDTAGIKATLFERTGTRALIDLSETDEFQPLYQGKRLLSKK
jgi:phenylacetate-coenzyme A ligase PaaK-like adenylate-forming protein